MRAFSHLAKLPALKIDGTMTGLITELRLMVSHLEIEMQKEAVQVVEGRINEKYVIYKGVAVNVIRQLIELINVTPESDELIDRVHTVHGQTVSLGSQVAYNWGADLKISYVEYIAKEPESFKLRLVDGMVVDVTDVCVTDGKFLVAE